MPPKWQGWLSHQYDDVPCDIKNNFVNHEYIKEGIENMSYTPLHYKPSGSLHNMERMAFMYSFKSEKRRRTAAARSGRCPQVVI